MLKPRRFVSLLASLVLLATLGGAPVLSAPAAASDTAGAAAQTKFATDGTYIVQMADAPVVAYEGGIKGLRATAPKAGQKIDPQVTKIEQPQASAK